MLKQVALAAALVGVAQTGIPLPASAQNAAQIAAVKAGQSCPGCNLFQAELGYTNLSGLDLSGARLRQGNLSLGTFDVLNLSGANLSISDLFGARFNQCNFTDADLSNSSAVGTYFGASSLSGAKLDGANLSGAELHLVRGLTQSQLDRACGDPSTRLPSGFTLPACR